MRVGDVLEAAVWLDGRETQDHRKQFEQEVQAALARASEQHGHILGPLTWIEKLPGTDRVPPVPPHVSGPLVRLLVAEAKIVGMRHTRKKGIGFVHDLEPDDLARLRKITREAYAKRYPRRKPLTDRQCETIINDLGPETALDTLRGLRRSELH